MNTERTHPNIHAATVDRSNPTMPKRSFAKDIVSNSRRLRARVGVAIGLCLGLAALLIAFE
jgi:hypothetical protein